MKKCIECGSKELTRTTRDHRYVESGLDNVVIRGAVFHECDTCKAKYRSIKSIEALHRTIAEAIVRDSDKLSKQEVKFLRKHLGYSNRDFAKLLNMDEGQTSRWQSLT